ncbi:MAG: NrsF family protein [Vicinamibacterales bacterium]
MNTDDLITRLSTGVRPVRVLAPPWQRAAYWLACCAAYVAAVVGWAWLRRGSLAVNVDPPYVVQQIALLATAYGAAVAAFSSVVPGRADRAAIGPLVSAVVLMAALAWGCVNDFRELSTLGVGQETDWPCVLSITLGGAALWGIAMWMLKDGAPLTPGMTSLLAGAGALSIANIEACITRGHAFTVTIVLWHGVATVVVLAFLTRAGFKSLRWQHSIPGRRSRG